jgi:hypothetical protein
VRIARRKHAAGPGMHNPIATGPTPIINDRKT